MQKNCRFFGIYLLSNSLKISALALIATPAFATQPLGDFISAAETQSFEARESSATVKQHHWEAEAARGRLLPSFTARGSATHNQFEAELPPGTFPGQTEPITITPQNQFDATFQVDVPLVDLASYQRFRQARHLAKASELSRDSTGQVVQQAVAQAYFTFLGASALVQASEKSLTSAEANLAFVETRGELGAATELDLAQAEANVERCKQDIADARLLRTTSARNLETLTGMMPEEPVDHPVDNLEPEKPLNQWLDERDTPRDRVQAELEKAAWASKKSASYALFPTLTASAQERISNAAGFSGQNASYSLSAVLTWRLDWSTYSTARSQAAAAEVQAISSERSRRSVEDTIFTAYHRVEAEIAKSAAARAREEAAERAARLSGDRYRAGTITQLDVIQSQRDAFNARAARIKADADLALARVLLRVSAGQSAQLPEKFHAPSPEPSP